MKLKDYLEYNLKTNNYSKLDLQMFKRILQQIPYGYFSGKSDLISDLDELIKEWLE